MIDIEVLEPRELLATVPVPYIQNLHGHVVVISGPYNTNAIVVTNDALTINGQTAKMADIVAPYPLLDLYFSLGDGVNTILNYSAYPSTYELGMGQNTIYCGTGPSLAKINHDQAGPHGFDAVVSPLAFSAIDIRGGPGLVITNPLSAVAADNAAEVFRILVTR